MNKESRGQAGEAVDSSLKELFDRIRHLGEVPVELKQEMRNAKIAIVVCLGLLAVGVGMSTSCARSESGACGSDDQAEAVNESPEARLDELLYKALEELNVTQFEKSLKTLEEAEALLEGIKSLEGNPSIKRRIDCIRARDLARKAITKDEQLKWELFDEAKKIALQVKDDEMGPGARADLLQEMDEIERGLNNYEPRIKYLDLGKGF